jgi:nucleoside-diphosphate-sugar epimerase
VDVYPDGVVAEEGVRPLDPDPPVGIRRDLDALRYLERVVLGLHGVEGVVLRYGTFYGPGTSFCGGGIYLDEVRRRRFPLVGGGSGIWSFIHVADAAQATRAAGELAVVATTQIQGASNAKAKHELGWEPTFPSRRDGFRHGLFEVQ